MKKYIIAKVKTFDGVKYAIQTKFTHYPVQYDSKGNMLTDKKTVKSKKKSEDFISIEVPRIRETETMHTVEYRKEYKNPLTGKKEYKTMPALFENTSKGLAEAKKVRDELIKRDEIRAKKEAAKNEKGKKANK